MHFYEGIVRSRSDIHIGPIDIYNSIPIINYITIFNIFLFNGLWEIQDSTLLAVALHVHPSTQSRIDVHKIFSCPWSHAMARLFIFHGPSSYSDWLPQRFHPICCGLHTCWCLPLHRHRTDLVGLISLCKHCAICMIWRLFRKVDRVFWKRIKKNSVVITSNIISWDVHSSVCTLNNGV
jgi:hypothetical protein